MGFGHDLPICQRKAFANNDRRGINSSFDNSHNISSWNYTWIKAHDNYDLLLFFNEVFQNAQWHLFLDNMIYQFVKDVKLKIRLL